MRIAICDDDQTFISILTRKLNQIFANLGIIVEFSQFADSQQLIDLVASSLHPFDIYFLDIEMPGKRGTAVAREIRQRDAASKIAFITSYDDEVFNAFHYRADAFIPKTMLNERLEQETLRLVDAIRQDHITNSIPFDVEIPLGSRHTDLDLILRLTLGDILYFESNNRKVLLHAVDATYILKRVRYQDILKEYLARGFVESRRCFLINIAHIKAVGKQDVLLDNDERITLSRRQYETVVVRFMNYMRR